MDQIGNYVLPSNGRTFHTRGAKQVDIVAKDEKRACTLTVGSSMSGVFLPFQQIWGGATDKVQPSVQAPRMADAIERGFDFTFAKSMKKGSHYRVLHKSVNTIEFFYVVCFCLMVTDCHITLPLRSGSHWMSLFEVTDVNARTL